MRETRRQHGMFVRRTVTAAAVATLVAGAVTAPAEAASRALLRLPDSAGPVAAVVSPCPVPATLSTKVRILVPDKGAVFDLPHTPSLDVNGLIKGKGSEAVTGVQLSLDGVDVGTAPVVATTPETRSKGADARWDRGITLTPGPHELLACARTAAGPVAVDSIPIATEAVTTSTLPDAVVGQAYSTQLTTNLPNPVWSIAGSPSGAVWPGLSLSGTGLLSGTPTSPGAVAVIAVVTNRKQTRMRAQAYLPLRITQLGGTVCAWGQGESGQLGDEQGFDAGTATAGPATVGLGAALNDVKSVAASESNGYALKNDGTVWAWGSAAFGNLGPDATAATSTPVRVTGLTGVTAVAAAESTAYALKQDGTVWSWGLGGYGNLGNGSYDGTSSTPVQVTGLTGVTAIAGAGLTAYALKGDGTVWGWGNGEDGQLGVAGHYSSGSPVRIPGLSGVTAISGQYHDGYALKGDGTVWAWGAQLAGALGNGTTGDAEQPTPVRVATLSGVTAIGAATDNGYARRSDGTLWAWGAGAQGAVGNGTTADSSTPVRVSGLSGVTSIAHSTGATAYATLADGTVWAWGLGDYGALGDGHGLGTYQYVVSTPVRVGALTGGVAAAGGQATGYALVRTDQNPVVACPTGALAAGPSAAARRG